jgi:hypothetical protein
MPGNASAYAFLILVTIGTLIADRYYPAPAMPPMHNPMLGTP